MTDYDAAKKVYLFLHLVVKKILNLIFTHWICCFPVFILHQPSVAEEHV